MSLLTKAVHFEISGKDESIIRRGFSERQSADDHGRPTCWARLFSGPKFKPVRVVVVDV